MSLINDVHKMERVDQLIRLRMSCTPKELAKKLGVSERTVYRIIRDMKDLGCPIYYDIQSECYCYETPGRLYIKFFAKNNTSDDE
jgi:predicted DNA-binding transcriptional regulator YafY